ncbi:amidohydrolase family protein [Microbacterium sp. ASV49]|uniref:Amidohydrolase family protein n=2 Tax=Microbacterium candidum TaxID=3041922 RepID=A0ABT7MYP2_9MICO|nr:amidohydrolase family protein [Microbacterium sp. ASV49]MDL9979573.1 amidohydrolase family protein [Microbacterium sp. ASV49]
MLPTSGPFDVFLESGEIADIAPAGVLRPRGEILDAAGRFLIPGLWDHHVHTTQWALTAQRADLGGAESAAHAARLVAASDLVPDGRRVGAGYRDALWAETPTLALLDELTGETPTYLLNADAHSMWLNSAAQRREGISTEADGILREEPAFEVSKRLNAVDPDVGDRLVTRMAKEAASRGVVGIVDLDMAWNEESWMRRLAAGFDTLRVEFGVYPDLLPRALAEGLRTGDPVRGADSDLVTVGPLKVITDGSLGTRTAAVTHPYDGHDHGLLTVRPAELRELMAAATAGGLRCAIHAIGDEANSRALDAFAATGAWGSIEHAQLVAHADIPRFARLGVAASVQPEHALDDRDMADALWAGQTSIAYPMRSLVDAGATLLLGSDAPVSPLDPWAAIAAAVFRARDGREPWRPEETVDAMTALGASTRAGSASPDALTPGAPADIAMCDIDPMTADDPALRAMRVSATLLAGRLTYGG